MDAALAPPTGIIAQRRFGERTSVNDRHRASFQRPDGTAIGHRHWPEIATLSASKPPVMPRGLYPRDAEPSLNVASRERSSRAAADSPSKLVSIDADCTHTGLQQQLGSLDTLVGSKKDSGTKSGTERRTGEDRRRIDIGPPGKHDRRRSMEPRKPEVVELDMSNSEWSALSDEPVPPKK